MIAQTKKSPLTMAWLVAVEAVRNRPAGSAITVAGPPHPAVWRHHALTVVQTLARAFGAVWLDGGAATSRGVAAPRRARWGGGELQTCLPWWSNRRPPSRGQPGAGGVFFGAFVTQPALESPLVARARGNSGWWETVASRFDPVAPGAAQAPSARPGAAWKRNDYPPLVAVMDWAAPGDTACRRFPGGELTFHERTIAACSKPGGPPFAQPG